MIRRLVLAAAGLVLAAGMALANTPEMHYFRIGTGTTGGTYFPIGGLIANSISNPPGSRPCESGGSCGVPGLIAVAQATSGAVENITLMTTNALEAAMAQADIAYWAYHATGPYQGKRPVEGLRSIANLYPEALHIVVRADSQIRSVADLKGKTVSLGEEGSGTLVEAREIFKAYGLSERRVKPVYLRPGPSADRLAAGEIDAFFLVAGAPAAAISDLAARTPIRLLPLDDPKALSLRERLPFLIETDIPENTYPETPPVRTLAVGAQLLVRADLPDDLVYGITRALWRPETQRLLEQGHPQGQMIRLANARNGLAVPLHPGAERFYNEQPDPEGAGGETGAAPPVP